jgi:hypothetical protein
LTRRSGDGRCSGVAGTRRRIVRPEALAGF